MISITTIYIPSIVFIANLCLMMLMMCFIVYMSYIVSGMKYSFWYIFMRALRHNDIKPYEWILENKYLISVPPLMISVFVIILAYLNQLSEGIITVRPEIAVISGAVFWVSLLHYTKSRDEKLRKYEKDNKI